MVRNMHLTRTKASECSLYNLSSWDVNDMNTLLFAFHFFSLFFRQLDGKVHTGNLVVSKVGLYVV